MEFGRDFYQCTLVCCVTSDEGIQLETGMKFLTLVYNCMLSLHIAGDIFFLAYVKNMRIEHVERAKRGSLFRVMATKIHSVTQIAISTLFVH